MVRHPPPASGLFTGPAYRHVLAACELSSPMARLASRIPVVLVAGSPDAPVADVIAADNRAGT